LSGLVNVTSPGFIGFASPFPIRAFNATFFPDPDDRVAGMNFVIDNVIASAVPEPSVLLLLAVGLGLLVVSSRRTKRKKTLDKPGEGGPADSM
jgi:hypothetical protein